MYCDAYGLVEHIPPTGIINRTTQNKHVAIRIDFIIIILMVKTPVGVSSNQDSSVNL